MSKYGGKNFFSSMNFAFRGLKLVVKSQKNFRRQVFSGIFILILAWLLKFSYIEYCILLLVISFILVCEMFNSVFEFTLDAYTRNKYSKLVEMAKDISAGSVLTATIFSSFIGFILFINKIYILFIK